MVGAEPGGLVYGLHGRHEGADSECDKSQVAGVQLRRPDARSGDTDQADEVIRPAILWNDGRSGEETDYLNQTVGSEKLSAYTANIAHRLYSP